jgi:hypothetical protein
LRKAGIGQRCRHDSIARYELHSEPLHWGPVSSRQQGEMKALAAKPLLGVDEAPF